MELGARRAPRRRNRRRNTAVPTPGTSTTPVSNPMRSRRRRRQRNGCNLTEGEIRLRRRELLTTVEVKAGTSSVLSQVDLEASKFKFLASLYNSFERIKFHRLAIVYKSAVGTTVGGMITYAIDWTCSSDPKDRATLSSYTPNMSHPVWESPKAGIQLPAARLQSRAWYVNNSAADIVDRCPARLLYAAEAAPQVVGEIWVEYDVTMSGTKA